MPALLERSSQPGENRNLNSRSWWDIIDGWIKDHSPGKGGTNGHGGGSNDHTSTTTTKKPTAKPTTAAPKPTTHTSSNAGGGGGGAAAPTSSSGGKGNNQTTDKGDSNTSKPSPSSSPKPSSPETGPTPDSNPTSTPAPSSQLTSPPATPSGDQEPSPTQTGETTANAVGLNQSRSLNPSATANSDPEIIPAGGSFNIAAVLVPVLVLVLAFSAIIFAVWYNRRRRRRIKSRGIGLNSNDPSSFSVISAPSIAGATVGATSARTSVAGGMMLPPRGGTRPVGMDEIAESRPVSLSSSAFGMTNPFAERAGLATNASTPYGSEAGHSTTNLTALAPSRLGQTAYSSGHSIVGSGDFSTASAHHGHGAQSLSPTPAFERENPFGNDARIAGGPNLSHTRLVFPSMEDVAMSEDVHVSGYGAAIASSVGHGTHEGEDRRSMLSYAPSHTPTSLFFRLSQDMRNSLTLVTEPVPPLPPKHFIASPITPETPTPHSAAPLLGVAGRNSPSPVWMRRSSQAPSPPPNGPLPDVPGNGRVPPSPLGYESRTNSVYGGLEEENGSQSTIVQLASKVAMQTPVFMSAPPAGRGRSAANQSPSADSFNSTRLQRSPSVLTSGSDDF
ncbi:hypothetical protein EXIGLDRAFT_761211 [Exidia glandulosa HHB12029]|uniref:Uncharacterized protein n=1 Tax=Exidia glandulosa HHB12029 TaxID=1314781 RepID=A0A165NLQ4_EXIGL|nr:hypothetical protein EXIGLDRAFT_761211 [Exidia glandulosa HHB12029]